VFEWGFTEMEWSRAAAGGVGCGADCAEAVFGEEVIGNEISWKLFGCFGDCLVSSVMVG
jgi:hypothetical protein